jgi:hypothetical protein
LIRAIFKQVLLVTFFVVCASINVKAQHKGYIVIQDSLYSSGRIRFNQSTPDSVYFFLSKKHPPKAYGADMVTEFGFSDSTQFISRRVELNGLNSNVFLQTLVSGRATLYEVSRFFFWHDENGLVPIGHSNYSTFIEEKSTFCSMSNVSLAHLVKYNRNSLSNFTRNYNRSDCQEVQFFNYGISFSATSSTLFFGDQSYEENVFGRYSLSTSSFSVGLFSEIPFWKTRRMSVVTHLNASNQSFVKELKSNSINQDVKITLAALDLSITPKFAILKAKRVSPYIFAGPSLWYNFKSKSELFQADIGNNTISFKSQNDLINFNNPFIGFKWGIGSQLYLAKKRFIFVELGTLHVSDQDKRISNFTFSLKTNL